MNAHNSVGNRMYPIVIHVLLLFIDLNYNSQTRGLLWSQLTILFQEFIEILPITPDVLKLLLDRGAPFAPFQIQIIFSGFVQDVYILRKREFASDSV